MRGTRSGERKSYLLHGCGLALAIPLAAFALLAGPVDWVWRYQSWSNLSKSKLVESAKWYVANRAPGNDACIFAVECSNGRASLKLVKSLDDLDLAASKQLAWDRKFKATCPGFSANFALELARDNPQYEKVDEGRRRAVWSFYDDRYIPSRTRSGLAAFSEKKTEPCLTANAVTRGSAPLVKRQD